MLVSGHLRADLLNPESIRLDILGSSPIRCRPACGAVPLLPDAAAAAGTTNRDKLSRRACKTTVEQQ